VRDAQEAGQRGCSALCSRLLPPPLPRLCCRRATTAACCAGPGCRVQTTDRLVAAMCSYSITLVCKRFRRLFYEQPGPWRCFEVELARSPKPDGYPAAKLALLRRVAPHAQEFVVCGDYGERSWDRPPASFLRLLPSSLVALEVRLDGAVPPAAAQLLHRLPDLRSLCLQGYTLPKDRPEARECLAGPKQLEIGVEECFDPDRVMAAIAQLGSLTQLLVFTEGSAHLRPPAPAAFPRLEAFKFYSVCQWTPAKVRWVCVPLQACQLCSTGVCMLTKVDLANAARAAPGRGRADAHLTLFDCPAFQHISPVPHCSSPCCSPLDACSWPACCSAHASWAQHSLVASH